MHLSSASRRLGAIGIACACAVATAFSAPASGAPASTSGLTAAPQAAVAPGAQSTFARALANLRTRAVVRTTQGTVTRSGPNPALALVPDASKLDYYGWARSAVAGAAGDAAARRSAAATTSTPPATNRVAVREAEPRGSSGQNDSAATAQALPLGTGTNKYQGIDLTGFQSAQPPSRAVPIPPNTEDDGDLARARETGVAGTYRAISTTGFIGDASPPDGEPVDDVDLYAVDLQAGQLITAPLTTTSGNLLPVVFLVDAQGNFLADTFFDDEMVNPTLQAVAPTAGRYYIGVVGVYVVSDEFTGPTTGDYALEIFARDGDPDTFGVTLRAGDVLGVSLKSAGRLIQIRDAGGKLLMGSAQDATYIIPSASPLPGGGTAAAELVAPWNGKFFVTLSGGDGPYAAQLEAYRPGGTSPAQQTIFLDLNGQRLNTGIWGGRGVTTLSPLSGFMANWGLTEADRPALGRRIKAEVVRAVKAELDASGLSSRFSVKVVTSDEVSDPFGQPGVMRVVVGGTIEESGISTIGIAQSIDPGNFDRQETALVLLDSLSEPSDGENPAPYSLNTYLRPRSNKLAFVAQGVGNVISHEIGHTIGNWHTDNTNRRASLMDAGGEGFDRLFGVGPDGVGGTADDTDVSFVTDTFSPFEGFTGRENTTVRSAWALNR